MSFFRKLLIRLHPYKTIHDDYLTRLRGSIAGESMLHEGNIYAFNYAIERMPAHGAVLEIGSFAGMSTNVLSWLLRKHGYGGAFFACDPWVYSGYYDREKSNDPVYMAHFEGSDTITREAYANFIKESFIRNTLLFSNALLPNGLPFRSDAFFEAWRAGAQETDVFGRSVGLGGALAFAYIDGDHNYETALHDVEQSLEFLLPGGFMLLDDSADFWHYGCGQVARDLRRRKGVELVFKNPNYLYRKV